MDLNGAIKILKCTKSNTKSRHAAIEPKQITSKIEPWSINEDAVKLTLGHRDSDTK